MKRSLAILLVLVVLFTMIGCSSTQTGGSDSNGNMGMGQKADDGKKIVGFLSASISSLPLQVETGAFEQRAKELGADEVIVLSAENSVETQLNQMRDLITRGCDVIGIYACDSDSIVPGVEAAYEAGIPVIAVDRAINSDKIYYTIASNNIGDGRDIANYFGYMTAGEPEGSVEVLNMIGSLSSIAQYERGIGFREACKNWPQLKIVGEPATEGDSDKTYNAVIDAFKTNPNIRGIMVTMDFLCSPVNNALKEIDKFYPMDDPKYVMTGGVDGGTEALRWLNTGECSVSISLDFEMFGALAAEIAIDYIDGKTVQNDMYQTASYICTVENIDQLEKTDMLWGFR